MTTRTALDAEIQRSRRAKGLKIAEVIWAYGGGSESAAAMDDAGRKAAEGLAHTRKGSPDTWALVAETLANWEAMTARPSRAECRSQVEKRNGLVLVPDGGRAQLRDLIGDAVLGEAGSVAAVRELDEDPFALIPERH